MKAPLVIEGHAEVVRETPAVIKKDTTVLFGEPSDIPAHNYFHRAAMLSTAQAACFLVLTGAELQRRKKELKHGEWEAWVEANCEYSYKTASRYMSLAEGVKTKALKAAVRGVDDALMLLLAKPAHLLDAGEQRLLLEAVHKLTDGATVQQLYLDFGITKKPAGAGATGGHRPGDGTGEKDSPMQVAIDLWTPTIKALLVEGLDEKSWVDLPDHGEISRESLAGVLIDLSALLRAGAPAAKKGGRK